MNFGIKVTNKNVWMIKHLEKNQGRKTRYLAGIELLSALEIETSKSFTVFCHSGSCSGLFQEMIKKGYYRSIQVWLRHL